MIEDKGTKYLKPLAEYTSAKRSAPDIQQTCETIKPNILPDLTLHGKDRELKPE
jgi:hypothetical protein